MSRLVAALISCIFSSASHATPIYNVDGGKLASIQNIEIGGALYDVAFQNGTFNSVFGDASNLEFTSSGQAHAASNTLLSLLVDGTQASDGSLYNFDTNNGMTGGCANYVYCDILTPYMTYLDTSGNERAASSAARNFYDNGDFVTSARLATDYDTTRWPWYSYASWSQSASVPEPGSIALLGLGLVGLSFSRRRKNGDAPT